MKRKRFLMAGAAVLVLIIAGAFLLTGQQKVEAVKAAKGVFTLAVDETGYVQSVDDREVQATQLAQVSTILVESGAQVETGQALMLLVSPELTGEIASVRSQSEAANAELMSARLQLELLEAELQQGKTDLDRKKSLFDMGAIAPAEYEAAQLAVTEMEKSLAQCEARIYGLTRQTGSYGEMLDSLNEKMNELNVVSPCDGEILDIPVEKGQVVSVGTPLIQVGSASDMEVKAELLSDDLRRVKVGENAVVSAPVLGTQTLPGKVAKIYPRAYEKTSALGVVQRRVPVLVSLEQTANLKPGYEVRVSIETMRKEGVLSTASGQNRTRPWKTDASALSNHKLASPFHNGRQTRFPVYPIGLKPLANAVGFQARKSNSVLTMLLSYSNRTPVMKQIGYFFQLG